MGTNAIRRTGADRSTKADGKNSGMTVDPGPYEAIVMDHVDGTRMGQLKVYIPDMGGSQSDPSGYITVSYASPFFGTTFGTDRQNLPDSAHTAGQSYGMWLVPPDIGNKVLVTFVAGDQGRGYWFACVYDTPSHHMVPGIGSPVPGSKPPKKSDALGDKANGANLPVVEASTREPATFKDFTQARFPHETQSAILFTQGLHGDKIRGAISSSSLREVPSNVYGISTPGRKATKGGDDSKAVYRNGGHQFVMDDGDKDGNDQLVRLRSASGHQILMNDKAQVLYIASASGKQWLEFSNNGQINVFADAGFNLRSKGTLNLHSDKTVNIQGASVHICADGGSGIKMETDGKLLMSSLGGAALKTNGSLNLSGMAGGVVTVGGTLTFTGGGEVSLDGAKLNLNGGNGSPPSPAIAPNLKSHKDAEFNNGKWEASGSIDSICSIVPTHEPWVKDPAKGTRPVS